MYSTLRGYLMNTPNINLKSAKLSWKSKIQINKDILETLKKPKQYFICLYSRQRINTMLDKSDDQWNGAFLQVENSLIARNTEFLIQKKTLYSQHALFLFLVIWFSF